MASAALVGVGFAVLSALALAAQSLTVRLGTRTRSVVDVIAVMFARNLLVLVPVAGVTAYPDYGLTARAVAAFAVAGLPGSLLARLCYFVGMPGSGRAGPSR